MRKQIIGIACVSVVLSAVSASAASQRQTEVVGDWRAQHKGTSGSVQSCNVSLTSTDWFGAWRASSFGCSGELFGIGKYRIDGSEVVLLGGGDQIKARLRLQGDRLVGTDSNGDEVTLTRKGAAPSLPAQGRRAGSGWRGDDSGWNRTCVHYGQTDRCATRQEMAPPQLRVVATANLRSSASLNSSVVTVLRPGTCVAVQECRQQGGDLWCKVASEGASGYLVQIASPGDSPRQKMLVFKSGCDD